MTEARAISDGRAPTRDEIDAWLEANCGTGLPYGEATDTASMLHGLAYVLRQIEGTDRYMVNIGQTTSATSALRLALDRFAIEALANPSTGAAMAEELMALREAVKPFVHFYEQANRVKGDLHQSFCDIDTGTSAALKPTHFAKLAALTSLSEDTTHAK